ncbi:MAG: hypothetical protein KGY51_12010 [Psychroflexus sp.]|nr:hypothetical protein [Psychroflexus sp.]
MKTIGYKDVKALKKDDTNSVLVECKKLGVKLWIDVDVVDRDIRADWNKYIFFTTDENDIKDKAVQEDAWNFELFTNEAVRFLLEEGVLVQDDEGYWSEQDH